jgi:predicted component of viral defense system (DUF524 family)
LFFPEYHAIIYFDILTILEKDTGERKVRIDERAV